MPKSAKFLTQLAVGSFLLIFLLIFFSSVTAKTLDIIIGGNMGEGLECEQDSDCPNGQFCHEEQYYCVACDVPPYEWTGTACECPAGTVEKDGRTCVECLSDTDCKADYYCDTDINRCTFCKFPKIWQDNACMCPDGTVEQNGKCVCVQADTELNEITGRCECILSEEKCAGVNFNSEGCKCCPSSAPVYQNKQCRPCAQINADTPVWDSVRKQCVQCLQDSDCLSDKPLCNASNVCAPCPDDKPFWNGAACVECLASGDCPAGKPVCDLSSFVCTPCPIGYPLWDETQGKCVACDSTVPFWSDKLGKCVECLTNSDCTDVEKPLCNTDTGVCEPCADNLYFNGEDCVACRYDGEEYDRDRKKCVIKLSTVSYRRDYGGNVGRRWMVNYGFGPYETDYEVWVEGYADDELYFDINRTLSYCHWSDNKSCSESDKSDPWKMGDLFDFTGGYIANTVGNPNGVAKMGNLKKGDFGAVHVGSNTGWLEWKATVPGGKGPRIWLERSVDTK